MLFIYFSSSKGCIDSQKFKLKKKLYMRKTICRVEFENTFLASTTSIFGVLANNDTMEAMATWAIMAENNFLEALF